MPRWLNATVAASIVVLAVGQAWVTGTAAVVVEAQALVPDVSALACRTCTTDFGPAPARWVALADLPAGAAALFAAAHDWEFTTRSPIPFEEALQLAEAEWRRRVLRSSGRMRYCRDSVSLRLARQAPALHGSPGFVDVVASVLTAQAIEHRFTRTELMEIALNRMSFGGAIGLDAAAWHFFGVPPSALTRDQLVALSGDSAAHIRRLIADPALLAARRAALLDEVNGSRGE